MMYRHFLLFFIASTSFFAQAQHGINWSTPVEVQGSTDAHRPRLALLPDNTPVLIWSQFTTGDKHYFFSKWDNGSFLPPVQLNDEPLLTYDWGGTELVANGTTLYTIFKEGPDVYGGRVHMLKSLDAGVNWEDKTMIEDSLGEITMYPNIYAYGDSNVLVTYMTHGNGGVNPQYIGRVSFDDGNTFSSPTAISQLFGDETCYCCPSAIVANDNYQAVAFRHDASNIRDVKAAVSSNGGSSFSTQISLDDHSWYFPSCPSTGPDLGINGSTLYATYMSKGEGHEMVYLAQDDLSDATSYQIATAVADSLGSNINYPELDNQGDSVVVVWQHTQNGETDLWYNLTFNGLAEWDPAHALPVMSVPGIQKSPDIAIGTDQSVHLVYIDFGLNRVMYTQGTYSLVTTSELQLPTLQLHPNPVSETLFLQNGQVSMEYLLYTSSGQYVASGTGNCIDVSTLKPGVYVVHAEGFLPQKVVIK